MFENLQLHKGRLVFNDFDICKKEALENQIDSLKEDLIQIQFLDKYIIDIGWYPEFNIKGSFRIDVVKDFDWTNPIYSQNTRDLNALELLLNECIRFVEININ